MKKLNLRRFSFLVPDPSQGIGESVFVAPLAEQGNFTKNKTGYALQLDIVVVDEFEAVLKQRKEFCLFSGAAGREEFESWRARVRPISRNIGMSLQEKTLLQFLPLKSLLIDTCCCYPPHYQLW